MFEEQPLLATHHPQRSIPKTHTCDIVVFIIWSRLGELLPADTFPGPLSGRPVTGTEYEFEEALEAAQANDVPKLLLYKKTEDARVSETDRAKRKKQQQQIDLVDDFIDRWFGDAQSTPIKAALHQFETPEHFAEMLEKHLSAILAQFLHAENPTADARWHERPFRGLLPFEFEHAPVFFGRIRARNEVRALLASQVSRGRAFVLVIGGSGSGKSSLVKAGVLPELVLPTMIGRVALCRYAVMRPEPPTNAAGDLVSDLAAAIIGDTALPELKALVYTRDRLAAALREGTSQSTIAIEQGLAAAGRANRLTNTAEARLILVVDQLENIFDPRFTEEARSAFVAALDVLSRCGFVWVIATLRSDFSSRIETLPALSRLADPDSRYALAPPTDAELGQMIRDPAREAGLQFEVDSRDGTPLDERIREAAARSRDSLPLLSFLLDELSKQGTDEGLLTIDAYQNLGGLQGALAKRADEEFRALPDDVRSALPRVLRELVTIGSDGKLAASAAPLAMFPEGSTARRLIEAFAAARLFVIAADPGDSEPKVRVAHEALLTHWGRAQEHLMRDRPDIQLKTRLREHVSRWYGASRRDRRSLLLQAGLPIEEAMDLRRRRGDELPPGMTDFIAQSAAAIGARRRARYIVAITVVLVLAVFALVSARASYVAERERNSALIAGSRLLAHESQSAIDQGRTTLGLQRALDALPQRISDPDRPFVKEAEAALEMAFASQKQRTLKSRKGKLIGVISAAFSPDGTQVAAGANDKIPRIWDVRSAAVTELAKQGGPVWGVAFSTDGKRLVIASDDGKATVYDAKTGAFIARLNASKQAALSAAFTPDDKRIVTTSKDGTLRFWDARTQKQLRMMNARHGWVWPAAFSPDGARVITGFNDGFVRIWDAKTGARVADLRGHIKPVYSAAFSPDGARVVTASKDKTVRIWDQKTGAVIRTLLGRDPFLSAAFAPDSIRVVTASNDGSVQIWDSRTGASIAELHGHHQPVWSAEFSPDGTRIVTASLDGARLWDRVGVQLHCQALIDAARKSLGKDLVETRPERDWLQGIADLPSFSRVFASGDTCQPPH